MTAAELLRARIAACDRRMAAVAAVVKGSFSIPQIRKAARVMDRIECIKRGLLSRQDYAKVREFFCEGGLQRAFGRFIDRNESIGAPRTPTPGVAHDATTPAGAQ